MNNFFIRNEASFLYNAANLCQESQVGNDGAWQVAPFQCSIPYDENCLEKLSSLKSGIKKTFPSLFDFGFQRAQKAYNSQFDTISKPSYNMRLEDYHLTGLNQLDLIESIASKEAWSGGLVFSVFSPEDLVNRKRPGYVPCLIAGSFLEHNGELQLNAFFRSQSVVEFGIFDLEFLRTLQVNMAERLNNLRKEKHALVVGSLNLHFARILVQRRFCRNRKGFIRRDALFDDWLKITEEASFEV